MIIGRDAAHIIVNRRQDRDRLLGHIDPGKDLGGFRNAGQALVQDLWVQMVQM